MAEERSPIDGKFLRQLELLDFQLTQQMKGRLGGMRMSRTRGSSVEWLDFQEYQPGDDPRRIDWNMAARFDSYFIRSFADETRLKTTIYLDASASMAVGTRKRQCALQLAAAFAYLAVSHLDRATICLLQNARCIPAGEQLYDRPSFYRAAEQMQQIRYQGESDLCAALKNDPDPGSGNGISILISDLMTDSDWQGALTALLARKRQVLLVHLLSPEEICPPGEAAIRYLDAEEEHGRGIRRHMTHNTQLQYAKALNEWTDSIDAFCRRKGIGCLRARSDETPADILLRKGLSSGVLI